MQSGKLVFDGEVYPVPSGVFNFVFTPSKERSSVNFLRKLLQSDSLTNPAKGFDCVFYFNGEMME